MKYTLIRMPRDRLRWLKLENRLLIATCAFLLFVSGYALLKCESLSQQIQYNIVSGTGDGL